MSKLDDIALRRSLIDGSVTVADADWLIARVRELEQKVEDLEDEIRETVERSEL